MIVLTFNQTLTANQLLFQAFSISIIKGKCGNINKEVDLDPFYR